MGKKKDGAAGATGTTKKASKTAASEAPKVKTYKRLGDALAAFDNGEFPRGTKLVIAEAGTSIVVPSRKGDPPIVPFHFLGTPTEFAAAVLRQVVKTRLKVEYAEQTKVLPASSDDGE
jgi:hypothetical protein